MLMRDSHTLKTHLQHFCAVFTGIQRDRRVRLYMKSPQFAVGGHICGPHVCCFKGITAINGR